MFAIVSLVYKVPLDVVLQHVDEHRAYLKTLHERGKLLASGPYVPRTGGALILRAESEAELREMIDRDPFYVRQIADYETRVWAPTIGVDRLES
jgi:uncharacterized protein YciI